MKMARPTTKPSLMAEADSNYQKLNQLIDSMTAKELSIAFDFSDDDRKKEAHWRRDKNLRDVLVHLYEWHQLVLNWVDANMKGEDRPFLPAPYNWKTYGAMNVAFFEKHQNTSLDQSKEMFEKSHQDVLKLADTFTNEELFTKGTYKWVGGSTLGSYFVSATASHYDWAMKKIKAHIKNCKGIKNKAERF